VPFPEESRTSLLRSPIVGRPVPADAPTQQSLRPAVQRAARPLRASLRRAVHGAGRPRRPAAGRYLRLP